MTEDQFIDGECDWCEEKTSIYADTKLCEDCDSNSVFCSVCQNREHRDSSCRHVFQDENFEWTGSGAYGPSEQVAASFTALIRAMPPEFAGDLRAALVSKSFHTWLVAPLIGRGGHLTLHGIPLKRALNYGDRMLELGEGDDAEDMYDGYYWLASLYDADTPDANAITVGWIDKILQEAGA